MNEKILYEKIGRKYIPVKQEYKYDCLEKGHWLINIMPNSTSLRYKLNPEIEYPNLAAALEEYKDEIVSCMSEASKLRPHSIKMSKKEIKAWNEYKKIMGKNIPMYFGYMSLWDIANAGIKRLGEKIIEKRKNERPKEY